ncbi:MAG: cytochrome c-type biosis protein [Cryptosporangiaceae bacterium]|nr:cytochrome c-type biosis protein [Cryptosporangiaceae bacterium]
MLQSPGGIGYAAAFAGGLVSFLSPCVLPVVPPYLSLITGVDVADLRAGGRLHSARIARQTALFIGGFSAVFVALGLSATAAGRALAAHQVLLVRVSGLVVLGMGLVLLVSLAGSTVPGLDRDTRFQPRLSRFGVFAAPVAGAAFGFGWTPCIGPVLASVLAVAATQAHVAQGGLLLTAYSAGLAVPFLALGLLYGRLLGVIAWVRRHTVAITLGSGLLMAVFGILLTFNRMTWITSELQHAAAAVGLDPLVLLG